VRLYYETLGSADRDAPTLLLANGLGGKLYAWEPLVERFAASHRIVTWDYRGLFRSGTPARRKHLSINHHAADAVAVLDACGVEQATFVGWSMGVQVCLEAALEYSDRVTGMVLLNGSYGHVFETGLQPLFRLPRGHWLLHAAVERLERREPMVRWLGGLLANDLHTRPIGWALSRMWGNPRLGDMYRSYIQDVFGPSLPNYLRLFQELDAHSVYHLLPEVQQPALVISGALDWLTPAIMSFEIARRIPRSEHLHLWRGSHFSLLEESERVLARMTEFLARG
jgi:pimeloyl-ACP methyl ester carboxylesterase